MNPGSEPTCTRMCKSGRPCQKAAIPWRRNWNQVAPTLPNPVSCMVHLTIEERTDLENARARHVELSEAATSRDPACWSWPVPDLPHLGSPDGLDEEALLKYEIAAQDLLDDWQAERCGLCGGSIRSHATLDHDHQTGLVRGWLHGHCNTREGLGNSGQLKKYRERNPASILGLRLRYYSSFGGFAEPAAPRPSLDDAPSYLLGKNLTARLNDRPTPDARR